MARESGIFYKSYYEAISSLPEASRLVMYEALMAYIFDGKECELNGVEKAFFTLIKPQIDANTKRYENGKKGSEYGKTGGAPRGNKNAKKALKTTVKQPRNNPDAVKENNPKTTPNKNDNVNVNVNVNEDDNACALHDFGDAEKTSELLGVISDEPPAHTLAEYEKAAEALKQSSWARKSFTHLSKIHKHWNKLLSGYYADKAGESKIITASDDVEMLNRLFDAQNDELL